MKRKPKPKQYKKFLRRHHVHVVNGQITHVPDVPGLDKDNVPFMGELMTCSICRRQKRSNPLVMSGWYCLVIDGQRRYICPRCASRPPTEKSA